MSEKTIERLNETREFINHLVENNIKTYGITTGFADLRNYIVAPEKSA
jgi:histidine ammonia-lyase